MLTSKKNVDDYGRVHIPSSMRKILEIGNNEEVSVGLRGGLIVIKKWKEDDGK